MKVRSWVLPSATVLLLAVAIIRIEKVNENLEVNQPMQTVEIDGVVTERGPNESEEEYVARIVAGVRAKEAAETELKGGG